MASKYTGYFNSININYKVEISSTLGNETKEITLGVPPVIIDYPKGDTIYSPIKCSTASIKLITSNIIPNLMVSNLEQTTVEVTDITNNALVWQGHLTPSIYSQNFDYGIEELELEAVDNLAALDYKPYSYNAGVKSAFKIITELLQPKLKVVVADIYDHDSSYTSFLHNIYLNTELFIKSEDYTNKDVLNEILKYLNLCIIQSYDRFIIYSPEYVDNATNGEYTAYKNYIYVPMQAGYYLTSTDNIEKGDTTFDIADEFKKIGTQISTEKIYKDVIINGSVGEFPSFSECYDKNEYENTNWKIWKFNSKAASGYEYSDVTSAMPPSISDNESVFRFKFKKNPHITLYSYDDLYENPLIISQQDFMEIHSTTEPYSKLLGCYWEQENARTNKSGNVNDYLESSDYLAFFSKVVITSPKKVIELTYDKDIIVGNEGYLCLKGSAAFNTKNSREYFINTNVNEVSEVTNKQAMYILCYIKVGDYYFDQENATWTTTPSTTKVYLDVKKGDKTYNTFYIFKNEETPDYASDGFLIPLQNLPNIFGNITVDFLRYNDGGGISANVLGTFIKGFDIEYFNTNISSQPIQFYNNLNSASYETYEVDNAITTFTPTTEDGAKQNVPSSANPLTKDEDGNYIFLNKLEVGYSNVTSEEHTINNLSNQYGTNILSLVFNGKNDFDLHSDILTWNDILPNKKFVISGKHIDLQTQTTTYNIIEKK